jgi:hypothetical protein
MIEVSVIDSHSIRRKSFLKTPSYPPSVEANAKAARPTAQLSPDFR